MQQKPISYENKIGLIYVHSIAEPPFLWQESKLSRRCRLRARAVDPNSFYADPDPAAFLNADPDPDPDPGPGPA